MQPADPCVAAIGASRVAEPGPALLQTLARGVDGVAAMDAPASASLLALGAHASLPDAVLADGRTALAALLACEARCRALAATDVWLQAIALRIVAFVNVIFRLGEVTLVDVAGPTITRSGANFLN